MGKVHASSAEHRINRKHRCRYHSAKVMVAVYIMFGLNEYRDTYLNMGDLFTLPTNRDLASAQ
jgi:hypothetical protein